MSTPRSFAGPREVPVSVAFLLFVLLLIAAACLFLRGERRPPVGGDQGTTP